MNLHELFTLLILPIGTSRNNQIQYMKYTSECILKLQIHQHSLLTRKVFSGHNSSAQVFVTGSFIKVGSSLDHHQSWIIIASTISSKWFYLSILLIKGSSTKPTLLHVDCRPSLHVGLHQQRQPFFMLDVLPFSCKEFSYRANPFSYQMQHLASRKDLNYRASPFSCWMYLYRANPFSCWMQASIEPTLFHVGCTSTELVLFHTTCKSLKNQSFFILDVGHYRANPFSCWMYLYRAIPFSCWMYFYRANPFSCWMYFYIAIPFS